MLIYNIEKINKLRNGKILGLTAGAFDLCHYGHVLMLEEAKTVCDVLLVGVHTDPTIDRKEKNKPIQSIFERVGIIKAIRYVDEIFIYDTEEDLYEFLVLVKPDIRIIGEDWKGKNFTGYDLNNKVYFNKRTHNFSSSELKSRIINQHLAKQS